MDARQLEYFLAVVDHGGVNRAAAALHLAQPSLSQAIRALERDLGEDLFHRVGRRMVLTDAGQALIAPARDVLRGLGVARDSVTAVGSLESGRVEIASMPSQAIEPLSGLIKTFTAAHPGLRVVIRAAATAIDVIDKVRSGVAELGMLASSDPPVAAGLQIVNLARQRFVVVAPPGWFTGRVRHRDLAGRPVIVGQPGTGIRRLADRIQASGISFQQVVESEHREAVLPLVLGGVGCAILAESWSTLARQAGADVFILDPPSFLHVALVSRARRSPAAEAFHRLCL
jgi:DNA-binding transcriptional LysR family regulator